MTYRGKFGVVDVEDRDGVAASLFVRKGTDDDEGVDEVWNENVYRMHPDYVRDRVVVDIGANIGAFSVWAAAAGAAEVHAYEPEPGNFAILKQNTEPYDNVVLHQCAVSCIEGKVGNMSVPGSASGSSTMSLNLLGADGEIDVVRFRKVIRDLDVAVLKMDIEGGEYMAFADVNSEELASVQRLVMEIHGPGMTDLSEVISGPRGWEELFGEMVLKLANWGHVDILGRPNMGGMIFGIRY